MSECQYHKFVAIDRLLTHEEMAHEDYDRFSVEDGSTSRHIQKNMANTISAAGTMEDGITKAG